MFTFQQTGNDIRRISRRIRRVLEARHAVHIGEVRQRLSEEEKTVEVALGSMMASGEIERLRPIDYSSDTYDYFRLNKPVAPTGSRRNGEISQESRNVHKYIRLAGESMVCRAS